MQATGKRLHYVTVEGPGAPVPDGDGGYTEAFGPLVPAIWKVSITRATQRDLENLAAGTTIAQAAHLIQGPYHPGITSESRITWEGRIFNVISNVNTDERKIQTELIAAEVVA